MARRGRAGRPADQTARAAERDRGQGVVHIPQGDGLFAEMTVEENLLMGAFPPASWRVAPQGTQRVYGDFPVVARAGPRGAHPRPAASGGWSRSAAADAAARMMLIDEPSLGLAPVAIEAVYEAIAGSRQSGATIVLVEENFTPRRRHRRRRARARDGHDRAQRPLRRARQRPHDRADLPRNCNGCEPDDQHRRNRHHRPGARLDLRPCRHRHDADLRHAAHPRHVAGLHGHGRQLHGLGALVAQAEPVFAIVLAFVATFSSAR